MDEHGESIDALMDGMGKREVPMPELRIFVYLLS